MSTKRLSFLALASLLAAVGCGGDSSTAAPPVVGAGMGATAAGTGAPPTAGTGTSVPGTAGTTAVGGTAGTGVAGTAATGVAGTAATGVAGTAATGTAGTAAPVGGAGGNAGTGAATAGAGAAGTGSAAVATFSDVFMIYQSRCALCHAMAAGANMNGNLGGIKDKAALYAAIVNKPFQGPLCMGKGMYVVPGKPDMSMLLHKLMDPPPCGSQMPVGNPLDPEDIQKFSSWIMAGAMNN